ncbi:MAG: PHP domain-containing protein [Desulfobacterota bacterium]|nr:PHP domain-containing protein [Thermodesulfobacteriota bacterium]
MSRIIDLHVHTHYSRCSGLKPEHIDGIARRQGLNAVAITDHNTLRGAQEVAATARNITVIVAEEIRTSCGDMIGYFLREEIPPGLSPQETIAAIRRQEGLVSVPHPFDWLRSSRMRPDALNEIIEQIDMLEVFNARDILTRSDERLVAHALKVGVVPVVGSDAHFGIEVGRARMILQPFSTPREFLESLRNATIETSRSPLWVHGLTKLLRLVRRFSR